MDNIDDEILLVVYRKAAENDLDKDFIFILEKELKKRGLLLVTEKD